MTLSETRRAAARRRPGLPVAGVLALAAAIVAGLASGLPPASSRTAAPATPTATASRDSDVPPSAGDGPLGEAGGAVAAGTTVFDDDTPGVANLDPALLGALRLAATDAADDGVEFVVDSGWRSPAYQEQLLAQAVSRYGSQEEAERWVATPATSAHVSGDAVDIGPVAARTWLRTRGAAYGLCQIYRNEPWHFELRPTAADHRCPRMYADAAHDPRMGS